MAVVTVVTESVRVWLLVVVGKGARSVVIAFGKLGNTGAKGIQTPRTWNMVSRNNAWIA